jgi:hypothetical protein
MPLNLKTWDLPALLPIREEGVLRIFIALKNPSPWLGSNPATFGSSGNHTNHYTTKANAQEVSRQPVTAEAWVRVQWELSWTKWHWDRFHYGLFGLPCQYHSTVAPFSSIVGGISNRPFGGRSLETHTSTI